jgi:DNA-binding NarL/FixJ family response regulator
MEPIKRSVPDGTHLLRFSTHPTLKLAQVPQWNLDAGIAEQRLADIRRPGRKAPGGQRRVLRTGPSAPLSAGTISNPEQRSGADHREPMLAVINDCMFFRDCIIRCLKVSYDTHRITAFATVSEWERWTKSTDGCCADALIVFLNGERSAAEDDLRELESASQDAPIIIIADREDVDWVQSIIRSGARGYVPTSQPFGVVIEAVRFVLAGGTFIPLSTFNCSRDKDAASLKANDVLTHRQAMVVEALCKGMANKQIAYQLGMSEHTVKVHLRHIMSRLNARNRTEVAILARRLAPQMGG